MGQEAKSVIISGQCAYVPTGGMIPEGADAMVMVEYCESFDEDYIAVYDAVSPGRNMVGIGKDMLADTILFSRGIDVRLKKSVHWLLPESEMSVCISR